MITITTNNHRREIVYWWELSDSERNEFDWIKCSVTLTEDEAEFFRYKGDVYCLSDIMRVPDGMFPGWDGYENDTFFSGILVKYPVEEWGEIDSDHVIVGMYYSE